MIFTRIVLTGHPLYGVHILEELTQLPSGQLYPLIIFSIKSNHDDDIYQYILMIHNFDLSLYILHLDILKIN